MYFGGWSKKNRFYSVRESAADWQFLSVSMFEETSANSSWADEPCEVGMAAADLRTTESGALS
jgi:hypothetical protein